MTLIQSHARPISTIFFIALLWLILGFWGPVPAQEEIIKLEVLHSQDHYQAGKTYPVLLRITITPGWFIHGDQLSDPFAFPTRFLFKENPPIKIGQIQFPKAEERKFDYSPEPLELFSGTLLVRTEFFIDADARPGQKTIQGKLEYQGCTAKSCIPVEELPVKIAVSVVGSDQPVQEINQELFEQAGKQVENFSFGRFTIGSGVGLILTLFFLFLGGLALNLTPCVYPLIPITVSYFGGKSRHLRRQVWLHSICYLLGLTFTNSLLGVAASLSGNLLGATLQNPLTLVFLSIFMVILAFNFFGFWEMRIPAWLTRVTAKNYKGYFGTFFMGLTLGIVAAPCIGPLILSLITYVAQLGDPVRGFLYFFMLSLGLGLPLAVLALFSGLIEKLPLSGGWMLWVRKFFGWVLIGMAVHFISTIIPWDIEEAFLLAGVAVAAALHLGWLEPSGRTSVSFRRIQRAAGAVILLAGMIYAGLEWFSERPEVAWLDYSRPEMIRAIQEQKPVILDFSAKWCGPCRIMDRRIFQDPEVRQLERTVVFLRMDLTFQRAQQKQVMEQYGFRGVPSILFFNREGKEERDLRIEELVSRAEFMRRMNELLRRAGSQ
ncbi:MAG: DUF255 domain-containing protein [Desulfobacteraceae bacterium]|nr:MAG: DUF255 domain-containing protein [Desulfobacteraceae bacterium]